MTEKKQEKFPPLLENPVIAGFPSPSEQYIDSPLDLNKLLIRNKPATFFVRVSGDSMIGAGIQSDDLLVVDRSLQPENGSIVIASVDNEFTVKYFYNERGQISLVPANQAYRTIVFHDSMEFQLFGVVTSVIHQFTGRK
ncbi:MAG: translesion error-prone DNA polymerase V autoproteolytic subunit [Lentisphaeria bacterium]